MTPHPCVNDLVVLVLTLEQRVSCWCVVLVQRWDSLWWVVRWNDGTDVGARFWWDDDVMFRSCSWKDEIGGLLFCLGVGTLGFMLVDCCGFGCFVLHTLEASELVWYEPGCWWCTDILGDFGALAAMDGWMDGWDKGLALQWPCRVSSVWWGWITNDERKMLYQDLRKERICPEFITS